MKKTEQDVFKLYQGEKDNLPWNLILTEGYLKAKFKEKLSWFLCINIQLLVSENGSISNMEDKILNDMEDDLYHKFKAVDEVYRAGRFTHNGIRSLFFYVTNPQTISSTLNKIIESGSQAREFDYRMERDPEWKGVREILKIPNL
ncbi:MAG TPA: DUF695 domain-containing protein [Candidatus Paceibacterota bacterium]|nr:DUF695 domain-containing protein [Candidatus Paceibacterota bacterium]